ncbi:MAG: shikimate kinase [Defluviitaleaceae bacterium]|nr:shikimate kinase [Defluviitaleaceae bacterium]
MTPHGGLEAKPPRSFGKVVIIGGGGSSLSVKYVMERLGAETVIVVSRGDNHAEFLRQHSDAEILVNCTPVGMYPNVGASPVSLDFFPKLRGVFDLIYNPARTELMIDAAERGIPAIGGLTMLVGQAAASSAIFTGREVKNAQEVLQNLRRKTENIILVGMPGSGKTTLGSSVALQLGKKFVDTDEEIIRDAGRSISEIFAAEGEAGFRARESAVTARVGKESGLVIATGGGCVTRDENYRSLHQNGTIIFIERDVSTLERCGRPLSQGDLAALYETRLPMYRRFADFTVDANCRPDMTARSIVEILM